MKHFFTILAMCGCSLIGFSQQKFNPKNQKNILVKPRMASAAEVSRSQMEGQLQLANHTSSGSRDAFVEDFSNGFAGMGTNGEWTFEDTGGNSIWMMADANSPGGDYSDPSEALVSATAQNGWVIFDADLYQGGEITTTNPAEDVSGYLISPPIDLSASTSVILEFQQAFRYCCADAKPFIVQVSNDGGTEWATYDAAPDFAGGANDFPPNPYLTTIDISGAAAGQGFVIIRFGWQPNGNSTHSHYFWGIDDIRLYENPVQNDVRVTAITNGDIALDYEYRCIAFEQAIAPSNGGLIVGTMYENLGTITQTATITAEVLDSALNVLASVDTSVFIFSNSESPTPGDPIDTVYVPTGWAPSETGEYFVRTTVTYGNPDDTPENNTLQKKFFVVDGEYGHDDPALIDYEMTPFIGTGTADDPYNPVGYGSYLTCFNEGSIAGGLSIRFDNSTDDFCPYNIVLLQRADDYNLSDAYPPIAYGEYEVLPADVPTGPVQQFPVYRPFDESVELLAGETYFAGIQTEFPTEQELAVKAIEETDTDFSTGYWAETTTDGEFLWFFGVNFLTNATPAIRLVLYEFTSTEEEAQFVTDFGISPNPASTDARIDFNLQSAAYIAYEVRDIQGKLVTYDNIGLHSQGANMFNLNVSDYPAGNYIFNLVIDGERMFTRQFNVTR